MQHHRTIWLSDVHLGTRGCNASGLLQFLHENDADTIFLVGDIIDGWRLRRRIFWPQEHNDIVQKLLRKARKGTRIVYIPGNHDEFLRAHTGESYGNIEIVEQSEHTTATGLRLLILHGDEFDGITTYHRWIAHVGDAGYNTMLWLNHWFNLFRRKFGFGHWSISNFCKRHVKQAVSFIGNFEATISHECRRRHFDGVVCGHIHHAEMRMINGILYCNTGDWVESGTALVESHDGTLSIIKVTP